VLLLPGTSRSSLAAGFAGFRLIFYLAPLMLALMLIAIEALRQRRSELTSVKAAGPDRPTVRARWR